MGLFPSSIEQQAPSAANPAGPGLAERWRGWLQKPENAAMLMQSGIAMLQPLQLGQGTLGAVGSAVGEGFQARDRVVAGQADAAAAASKQAMDQRELDLRENEGRAKADYYKRSGTPGGGVSASTVFRANESAQARKQRAWMEFLADAQFQSPDTPAEELYTMFEEAWTMNEARNPVTATPALPGLEADLPVAPPAEGGAIPTATDANGNKVQYIGGKWVPM